MCKSFRHISVLIITVFSLTPLPAQDFNAEIDGLMDKLIGFDQFSGTVYADYIRENILKPAGESENL